MANTLSGTELDMAVAQALGLDYELKDGYLLTGKQVLVNDQSDPYFGCLTNEIYSPSTDPNQALPILEKHIFRLFTNINGTITAQVKLSKFSEINDGYIRNDVAIATASGPTILIAAMRAVVEAHIKGKEFNNAIRAVSTS